MHIKEGMDNFACLAYLGIERSVDSLFFGRLFRFILLTGLGLALLPQIDLLLSLPRALVRAAAEVRRRSQGGVAWAMRRASRSSIAFSRLAMSSAFFFLSFSCFLSIARIEFTLCLGETMIQVLTGLREPQGPARVRLETRLAAFPRIMA